MADNLHMRITDLPLEERPQEKLLRLGAESLSNAELIAIILRTGAKNRSAIRLAEEILRHLGGVRGLLDASPEELRSLAGIGQVKAAQLLAFVELSKRVHAAYYQKMTIHSAKELVDILMPQMRFLVREVFKVVLFNAQNQILSIEEISKGTVSKTLVHPREVFRKAIRRSSTALVLVHNHPSGDPKPSPEDIAITEQLVAGSHILGIQILDHLILGDGRYISFKEKGLL